MNQCDLCDSRENLNFIETYTSAGVLIVCETCLDSCDDIFEELGIIDGWNQE